MTINATATLARAVATDVARPPGHAGWNNPVGDPHYNSDIDWYRRVTLNLVPTAGEYINIVNWEIFDGTIPFKVTTDITAGSAFTGTTPAPFGPLVNNLTTWTIWASNGSITASTAKYTDTGRALVSTLRSNGREVTLLLGNSKAVGDAATTWTAYAFLPGAFKVPTATATITLQNVVNNPATGVTIVTAPWTAAIGATSNLAATVQPAGSSQTVTWTSKNDAVVTVAARSGAARITGVGATTVVATSMTNPTISASLAVTGTASLRSAKDGDGDGDEDEAEVLDVVPDSSWTKFEIAEWLQDQGVDAEESQPKKELLALVQDVVSGQEPSDD